MAKRKELETLHRTTLAAWQQYRCPAIWNVSRVTLAQLGRYDKANIREARKLQTSLFDGSQTDS